MLRNVQQKRTTHCPRVIYKIITCIVRTISQNRLDVLLTLAVYLYLKRDLYLKFSEQGWSPESEALQRESRIVLEIQKSMYPVLNMPNKIIIHKFLTLTQVWLTEK